MDVSLQILSDFVVFSKYARYLPDKKRRETYEEIVTRNMEMHIRKFPALEQEIRENYKLVYEKKVLPAMRSFQFSGKAIELNPVRSFNCSSRAVDSIEVFPEAIFILLAGCFKKETLVKTKEGSKKIEEITTYDEVLTYDVEQDKYLWLNPTWAGETLSKDKKKIEIILENDNIIYCTEDHLFFTNNRGWVEAKYLTEEDDIKTP